MRPRLRIAWLALLLLASVALAARPRPHVLKRRNPTYAPLSDSSLDELVALTDLDATLDWTRPETTLAKLLVPRAVGSANLTRLQGMVEGHFRKLGWVRLPSLSLQWTLPNMKDADLVTERAAR